MPFVLKRTHILVLLFLVSLFCFKELVSFTAGLSGGQVYEMQDMKGDPENGEEDDSDEQEEWLLDQTVGCFEKINLHSLVSNFSKNSSNSYIAPYSEICLPPPELN